jgi:hypothetical protein
VKTLIPVFLKTEIFLRKVFVKEAKICGLNFFMRKQGETPIRFMVKGLG